MATFDDGSTGWTLQSGWTIANGKANSVASTGAIYQSSTCDSSKKYKATYTISDYVGGALRISWGNAAGTTNSGNGTFTDIISPTIGANIIYMAAVGFFLRLNRQRICKRISRARSSAR